MIRTRAEIERGLLESAKRLKRVAERAEIEEETRRQQEVEGKAPIGETMSRQGLPISEVKR